jgi:hypothetical protein
MAAVCNIKSELKFTALLASREPDHIALEYDVKGSHGYNEIMKWFDISKTTSVFEQIVRTPNGILYSPTRDAFVHLNYGCYWDLNMLAVLDAANVSTNNMEIMKSVSYQNQETNLNTMILEWEFDSDVIAEARKFGFVGPKFKIDNRFLTKQ